MISKKKAALFIHACAAINGPAVPLVPVLFDVPPGLEFQMHLLSRLCDKNWDFQTSMKNFTRLDLICPPYFPLKKLDRIVMTEAILWKVYEYATSGAM